MKHFFILLSILIFPISGFAQIEEMNEDEFMKKNTIKEVSKQYFFEPYDGQVSATNKFWVDMAMYGNMYDVRYPSCLVDWKGKQLLGVDRRDKYDCIIKGGILSSDEDATSFILEPFLPGSYYRVVDVYFTKNEVESLYKKLETRNSFAAPDNLREFYQDIEKTVIDKLIWDIWYGSKFEWPNTLTEETDIKYAIFVLQGEIDKRLYYIPYPTSYNMDGILINMRHFFFEEGILRLKKKYEGNRVVDYHKKEYILQKIAMKNGELLCAISDTASVDVEYFPLFDERKLTYDDNDPQDSICVLGMADRKSWFCLKSEVDSIESIKEIRTLEKQRNIIKKNEQKKRALISKYGEKNANSIIKGKACIGMTAEMVETALGKANSKSKSISNLGSIEVWTYSLRHKLYPLLYPITIVTFTNGKVSGVDEINIDY